MAGSLPVALYDAFSEVPFGGSQAAIVMEAQGLDRAARIRIARELGLPATGFVDRVTPGAVTAQFFSAVMEQPMCGHGTVCLFTHLIETGALGWPARGRIAVDLVLPAATAGVEIARRADGRAEVMLETRLPEFRAAEVDLGEVTALLGADPDLVDPGRPIEIAAADFVHLVLPVRGLAAIRAVAPDIPGLTRFCRAHGVETVALFATETGDPAATLHVRDFCPAVGVAESASAGTTNAALAAYLCRHGLVPCPEGERVEIVAEQGIEIGRPSRVKTVLTGGRSGPERVQVGGVATRIMTGRLGPFGDA